MLHKLRSKPTAGSDCFVLDVLILSEMHRRVAARCVEDIVLYDYKQARKCALLPFMVDKFQEVFALQEEARDRQGKRVQQVLEQVRQLEKSSWDRSDAAEDMGSAAEP